MIAKLDMLLNADGSLPAGQAHVFGGTDDDDSTDEDADGEGSLARAVRAARKAVFEDSPDDTPAYARAEPYSAFADGNMETGWPPAPVLPADDEAVASMREDLQVSAARIAAALAGMRRAIEVMAMFEAGLVAARKPDADRDALNAELVSLRQQMREIASTAALGGENWLVTQDGNATPDAPIAAGFQRGADGAARPHTIVYGREGDGPARPYRLIDELSPGTHGILTQPGAVGRWDTGIPNYVFMTGRDRWLLAREMAVDAATSPDDLAKMTRGAEYLRHQLSVAVLQLSDLASRIEFQTGVLEALHDAGNRGEADGAQQAKQDKAMKVRDELVVSPLPIANGRTEAVAALFR